MRYYSTSETAKRWNISARRAAKLASEGKIEGALMVGNNWMIPESASKPKDGRKKTDHSVNEDRFVFPDLIYGISSKDDPKELPPDEKQLYDGILQACKTDYKESIRILRELLTTTNRRCLRIGAYFYLQGAYIAEWKFGEATDMINLFYTEIESAEHHRRELSFMKQQLDSFCHGSALIAKPFDIDIDMPCPRGFLPFLAEENAYSDLCSLCTDSPRHNVVSHEIMCMELEAQGYYYAALLIHFYIAVMYSLTPYEKKRDIHLKKSLDLVFRHECYATIAFYLWFYPEFIPVLREYYPREQVDILLGASKHRIETSKAFLKYTSGSEMLQILTDTDHQLIGYAKSGYSVQQISEFEKVSISAVKQRLSKLYKKAGVNSRKELIERYNHELLGIR